MIPSSSAIWFATLLFGGAAIGAGAACTGAIGAAGLTTGEGFDGVTVMLPTPLVISFIVLERGAGAGTAADVMGFVDAALFWAFASAEQEG